jgi:hypothetical protein
LYKINKDGFVEVARRFDREMIYAISGSANGGLLLATGPNGRIYELRDEDLALVATVPEKQIVSISNGNNAALVTTTNSGAVYRMESSLSSHAEFRSAAKDIERFSRFGHYRIEGRNLADGKLAIAFRSGNTRNPDATWSAWSSPQPTVEGTANAPSGRYIQWKITMPKPSPDLVIDAVTVGYINRNIAPTILGMQVLDPGVVMISSSYPPSPQVVEATNPDEYGIFTSLESPRDRGEQGKKVFRKGYRTVVWKAQDENGDALRYSVAFRHKGADKWLRLRDNLEESQINFDTSQFPDGTYELRLTATDLTDNPEAALTDVKEGVEFQVDNTSPEIVVTAGGDDVTVRVSDTLSNVGKVEYSSDAQKWIRMTPTDNIADSRSETYTLKRDAVGGKFVVIRAVDSSYNIATREIDVR